MDCYLVLFYDPFTPMSYFLFGFCQVFGFGSKPIFPTLTQSRTIPPKKKKTEIVQSVQMIRTSGTPVTLRSLTQTLTSLCSNQTHPHPHPLPHPTLSSSSYSSIRIFTSPYSSSKQKKEKEKENEGSDVVSLFNRDPDSPPQLFVVQPRLRPDAYLQAKLNEALCLANSLEEQRDGYFLSDFFDKSLPPHILVQNPAAKSRKPRAGLSL